MARRWVNRFIGELRSSSEENRRTFQERLQADVHSEYGDEDEFASLSASSTSASRSNSFRMTEEAFDDIADIEDIGALSEKKKEFPKKDLFITKAIRQARRVQKIHPKRLLCGGLALKLYGVIQREKFSDIDFVTLEQNVVSGEYISLECSNPFAHCLFLSADVVEGETIQGLRLQALDQIIYWKTKWARDKDLEDLKKYKEKQFLTEEEFIINL